MHKKSIVRLQLEIEVQGDQSDWSRSHLVNRFVRVKHGGRVVKIHQAEVTGVETYDNPKRRQGLREIRIMKAVLLEGIESAGLKWSDFIVTGTATWRGSRLVGSDLTIVNRDMKECWSGNQSRMIYNTYATIKMHHRKEAIRFTIQPATNAEHHGLRINEPYALADPNLMKEVGDVMLAYVRYCETEHIDEIDGDLL